MNTTAEPVPTGKAVPGVRPITVLLVDDQVIIGESVRRMLVAETDIRFHRTIAQAAGNRVASALSAWSSQVLQPRLKDLIAPAIVEAVARDQHREIIAAIEQRKPVLAERAMRVHLRYLSDLLETVGPPRSN